ncbi:tetraacyldisaccharide 4'-kinase [Tamlana crocina]
MKIIRYLLFPVVPIYYAVTWLRNKLYDWGIKKSKSYPFPVICVGNLSTGGTGKSPMVEYLVRLLKDDCKLATLSRGYKRKTEGFQLADKNATAETLGDEPFQFYNKFKEDIAVAVDADRQNGIAQLQNLNNAPEVVLLDDAFQHRKVKAGFNILLTTYSQPYFKDMVLPTGNLREPKSGAKRADIIVVTKCPEYIGETEKNIYKNRIAPLPHQQVFFSSIAYADTVVSETESLNLNGLSHFTLVTGIANATPLVEFLKGKHLDFEHLNFKDHHDFSQQEIEILKEKHQIITTEKDFVRLQKYDALKGKLFYLPIKATIDDEHKFNMLIIDFIKR